MKVFISWSGERSEALAKALREWLPLVLHYVEPWLSQSDIHGGERWALEIAKELEKCNYGIICVTKENVNSPWILFEAGALAKSMQEGRLLPLLLDLEFKEVSGPLAQFQAKKADATGIKELVLSLNKEAANPVQDARLDALFGPLWPDLESQILSIPKSGSNKQVRPQGEILEELVSSVRNVEVKIRDLGEEGGSYSRRRRRKMHPMYFDEIMHRSMRAPDDPIVLLLIASFVREEAPWISELAMEAYREMNAGHRAKARETISRLVESFEMIQRGPFSDEFDFDRSFVHLMRSGLIRSLDLPMSTTPTKAVRPKPTAKSF